MNEELDNFLAHYGVKGMRWGVRRDTGSSGSASPKSGSSSAKPSAPKKPTAGSSRAPAPKPDPAKKMTDAELKAAIDRLNMEKQYKQLTSTPAAAKKQSEAKKIVKEVLVNSGKQVAQQVLTNALSNILNQAVSRSLGVKNPELGAGIYNPKKKNHAKSDD